MKRSYIIANALGQLDDAVLDIDPKEDKEKKRKDRSLRLLPGLAALFAVALAGLIMLPLFRPLMQKPGPGGDVSGTTDRQPTGEIDIGIGIPEVEIDRFLPHSQPYVKNGHRYDYEHVLYDAYLENLEDAGMTVIRSEDGGRAVAYGNEAILYLSRSNGVGVTVYAYGATGNAVGEKEKELIGAKTADHTLDKGDVLYAIDVSHDGFYEKTSDKLIMCVISPGGSGLPYIPLFIAGADDALDTGIGFEGKYHRPDICGILSCDIDTDGEYELLTCTPGPTSGLYTVEFSVFETGSAPRAGGGNVVYVWGTDRAVGLATLEGKPAVRMTVSDTDGAEYDVIKELVLDRGTVFVKESDGALNNGLCSPEMRANERAEGCEAETDDSFDFSREFDTYKRFVYDSTVDRVLAVGLKAFRAGGYTAFIRSEGSDYYILKGDHGERVKSPAYTLNLYTGDGIQYYSEYFVRSGIYAEENGIYKWDMANGKTASFISTKQPVGNTFRVGSMLYYVTHGKDTVTVKAADVRGENIYRIGSFECDEAYSASVIGVTSNGVFVRVNTGIIYFTGFDGSAEKLAEYDDVTLAKLSCDRLYVRDKNAVHELDENGEICSSEISGYVEIYGGMIVKVEKDGLKFITAEDGTVTRTIECAIPEPPADAKYRRNLYTAVFDGKMYLWAPWSDDLTYVDLRDESSGVIADFFKE